MKALTIILLCFLGGGLQAAAQSYAVGWFKLAGGGGSSAGGSYQVSGTVGQSEAGAPPTAGNYAVTGGFWSQIHAVQTPGLPLLSVRLSGGSVIVSWPATGSFTLEQNPDTVLPVGWVPSVHAVSTVNNTNQVTVTPPPGKLFFRLRNP